MDKIGEKLVILVTELKEYILMMEEQGYQNEESVKLKKIL